MQYLINRARALKVKDFPYLGRVLGQETYVPVLSRMPLCCDRCY